MQSNLTKSAEWNALLDHHKDIKDQHILSLFEQSPQRTEQLTYTHEDLVIDFSKNLITKKTLSLLCNLANSVDFEDKRDAMIAGEKVNITENRPALHTALRDINNTELGIADMLGQMKAIYEKLESNPNITNIIHVGIGGSDLGPRMVCNALAPFSTNRFNIHFLSNIDPNEAVPMMLTQRPKNTAVIIASKSWSTMETISNAEILKEWLGDLAEEQMIAITGKSEKAEAFGIKKEYILPLPDWVGGRYSLWSTIGLPIVLSIGFNAFLELLAGAKSADTHYFAAPLEHNIPFMLAALSLWYTNFCGMQAQAILPYNGNLQYFPAYLQQLEMESNGKSIDINGQPVSYQTSSVLFGEPGTNGQHAFYQLLHQGTQIIPSDIIACAKSQNPYKDHHEKLLASALGQARALMIGRENKKDLHHNFPGSRPSTFILLPELSPYYLGMMLAFYEHKTTSLGILWNINSFDQWGVELGKEISKELLEFISKNPHLPENLDPSTESLLKKIPKKS